MRNRSKKKAPAWNPGLFSDSDHPPKDRTKTCIF
jgi:hypothetical protein